jgi:hypothetical protein
MLSHPPGKSSSVKAKSAAKPVITGTLVGVAVAVAVGFLVGVGSIVGVEVFVGVLVGVWVGVGSGVLVGTGVSVAKTLAALSIAGQQPDKTSRAHTTRTRILLLI